MLKNRTLVLALVFALLCSAVHADSDVFDFSVGLSCSSKENSKFDWAGFPKNIDWSDFEYGMELRTKLTIFELDAAGKLGATEDNHLSFSGLLLGGISEDFLPFLRLGFCFGPKITYQHDGRKGNLVIDGNPVQGSSLNDVFKKSRFHFRGTLDILLGEVLKLGVAVILPTDFTIEKRDLNLMVPSKENLKGLSYALVVQMRLV